MFFHTQNRMHLIVKLRGCTSKEFILTDKQWVYRNTCFATKTNKTVSGQYENNI